MDGVLGYVAYGTAEFHFESSYVLFKSIIIISCLLVYCVFGDTTVVFESWDLLSGCTVDLMPYVCGLVLLNRPLYHTHGGGQLQSVTEKLYNIHHIGRTR